MNFSANGSFTNHKEKLKEKQARRSIFATRRYLDFLRLPTNFNSKLFDTLFLPILNYCSEVWGVYDKYDNSWEKDMIEKTHIYFCKLCLGVNKRSPDVASRNEIGRLPLKLKISLNILKFWIHLENQPTDSIAKLCLITCNKMAEENKTGLINTINYFCTNFDIDKTSINLNDPSTFVSKVKKSILTYLKNHQLNIINVNKKLTFFFTFKNETKYSDFINHIKNPEHRRITSKFRIGNHNLTIENGRFTIPKTPENHRICYHCTLNSVEDEMHFLFHCTFLMMI